MRFRGGVFAVAAALIGALACVPQSARADAAPVVTVHDEVDSLRHTAPASLPSMVLTSSIAMPSIAIEVEGRVHIADATRAPTLMAAILARTARPGRVDRDTRERRDRMLPVHS